MDRGIQLLTLFVFIVSLHACILRSQCRFAANFSNKARDKYFEGQVGITLQNLNISRCSAHCLANTSCVFFNHQMDNSICELLTSLSGHLKERTGWQFVSTNISDRYCGPMCHYITPKFKSVMEYCKDMCKAPGWKIVTLENVALKKHVDCSRNSALCKKLTNGRLDDDWRTQLSSVTAKIDLAKKYKIHGVRVYQKLHNSPMNYTIRVGTADHYDKASFCYSKLQREPMYEALCDNHPITGQFVFLQTDHTENTFIRISEIQVYGKGDP